LLVDLVRCRQRA